jgi:hypothetical protein
MVLWVLHMRMMAAMVTIHHPQVAQHGYTEQMYPLVMLATLYPGGQDSLVQVRVAPI